MNRFVKSAAWAAVAGSLAATPALAHPHIFIDAHATIIFDDAGDIIGIQHEWSFDEAFSAWQIQGLDTDGDGATSEAEMADLAAENMVGLADYQFYTFAGEGQDNLPFASMDNARMRNTDGRTVLSFGLEPQSPYRIKDKLEIAINDPEYYVAIIFADATAITLENAPADCAVTLQPPVEMAPELADQLYALPPEVTELPPELAAALRGVQGAIVVSCGTAAAAAPADALDAIANVTTVSNALPFGGPPAEPGLNLPKTGFFGWIQEQQKSFYQAMNTALAALKTDNNAFWILGGLSFLYGVFHAAGPGHGKVVISSYVLANERQVRRGIWLSFLSAMLQSVVAVAFVLVAALLLNMTSLAMSDAANWIGIISYALVALLGLWLIARKVFGWGHSHAHAPSMQTVARAHLHEPVAATAGGPGNLAFSTHDHHHHDHDHHHGHAHDHAHDHNEHEHSHIVTPDQTSGNWREQLAVVLSVGLRPCSGALVVLVFALSQGLLPAGIAAVFLMGLGVAITVGALAAIAVYAKGLAQRIGGVRAGLASAILWWVELAGAVAVFAFGMVLLLASI